MSILLTGSNGFLGSFIKDILLDAGEVVHTLSKSNSTYNFDLKKEFNFKSGYYKIVIHAAGKAHQIPTSEENEKSFYAVNLEGTKHLLKALTQAPPKQFVFISTVAVYGLSEGEGIKENAPLLATDPYGHSKIKAEKLVQEWCTKHKVICTILRLPLVAGANPPGNLGAMIKGIQKGYYFNIEGGKAKKSMVLAEDVAKFILKASEVGGIFNLTDGYHPDFNELSISIAKQLGKNKPLNMPLTFACLAAKFGDFLGSKAPINSDKLQKITSNLTFDDSKARAAFGWNPTPVLEGLKINS